MLLLATTTTLFVESFITPHYNHGMVKRIIDQATRGVGGRTAKDTGSKSKNEDYGMIGSSSCSNGPFGYCNSWGYVNVYLFCWLLHFLQKDCVLCYYDDL